MSNLTLAAGNNPGVTVTSTTALTKALNVVTLPLAAFTEDDTAFVSKQDAGIAVLGGIIGGFVLGDLYGAKVPLIGKRRKAY